MTSSVLPPLLSLLANWNNEEQVREKRGGTNLCHGLRDSRRSRCVALYGLVQPEVGHAEQ
jgi:hypothetical protein